MSAGVRVGAAAGSSAASSSSISIPANARKVVQDLKEIVKNSDDEIYAMLKECNMDPNETVQRLLNQDTFHEVKRKRDKKKENVNKEPGDSRTRAPGVGSSLRGGRPRVRGNYTPRYNSEFSSGGRGQPYGGRDNGTQQNGRTSNMTTNPGVPVEYQAQPKPAAAFSTGEGSSMVSAAVPNGSSQYTRVVQGSRGSLGPGQATMADIVKSSNAIHASATNAPLKIASQPPLYPPDGPLASPLDHVLHSYVDSHTSAPLGGKQNIGMVGLERSVRVISPPLPVEAGSVTEPSEQVPQIRQSTAYRLDAFSSVSDGNAVDTEIPSTSIPSSLPQELISPLEVSSEGPTIQSSSESPELSDPRASLLANQYNGRAVSQTLGSEKVFAGSGLEWRPKSPVKTAAPFKLFNEAASRSAAPQDNMELFLNSTAKLQQLSIHEDQPVIIPDHLQVPEADRTHLSFGSFGEDFDTGSNFGDDDEDDDKKSTISEEENLHDEETTVEQPCASSLVNAAVVSVADSYTKQSSSSPIEALVSREDIKISMPAPVNLPVSQPEVPKPETLVQQSTQHPILSAMHNYTGTGAVPQLIGGHFTYEAPEPQNQEVSRAPSFMSYSDPSANANYYNPVFRPSTDLDARYAQFVTASANKYSAGIPQMSGQGLSSSQEGGNSIVLPVTGPAGQTSQTVGLAQGTLTIPQQHIPIHHTYHSQHAGVPLTPFGANVFGIHYVPPSYGYMHSPYQHSYAGNTALPQNPGTFFAPGTNYGAAYPSTNAAAMKYALPQYKPGGAAGSAPHGAVAAGYGNFSTSPSGFTTINSAVTSATASGYEDASGPQYKENNLFIPNQQPAEGSGVWIQNPPSRDMTGMQTNSYYNLLNQGQHTSFAHTQPMHAVPAAAYASLYHQSQSGSAPAVHQLLQQPQALGAVGGVGTQSGAYQQQQRGQLSWPPNY